MRDAHLVGQPGRRAALRLMRRARVILVVLCGLGIAAGLAWGSRVLWGLALVILVEEMFEASVVISALNAKGIRYMQRAVPPHA